MLQHVEPGLPLGLVKQQEIYLKEEHPGSEGCDIDWSLITDRVGGYKMGKLRVRNFAHPPFKEWKLFGPPLQYG